jgi:LysR family transcriptional regulator of abg operon
MFALAGAAPPTRVVVCETLAAMSILRHSDAVSIFPQPLLGHPETRGIVAIDDAPLRPCDIELLLLTQSRSRRSAE